MEKEGERKRDYLSSFLLSDYSHMSNFFLLILCGFLFVCFCFSHYTNTFLRNDQAPIFRLCLPVLFSILRENF